jgi:cold shock protein
MVHGTVKAWDDDEGWGVLVAPDAPAEVWAHFTAIDGNGYLTLDVGAAVTFEFIAVPGGQDGYDYRATRIISTEV